MALLTPIGAVRVFVDGKPAHCELCRMNIERGEHVNGKYRLAVHFKADDDKQHLIMCCLKVNQDVTAVSDAGEKYACSTYISSRGGMKLSVGLRTGCLNYDGEKIEDRSSESDYDVYVPENNGEDGFYYDIYMTYPDTRTDAFAFGIAWDCDTEEKDNTAFAAESALSEEASDVVSMFDADDEHTEDYGISLEDYYQYSARGGNRSSMVLLGYIYEAGSFGYPDLDKAVEYFQMALDNGDMEAEKDIARLQQKKAEEEVRSDEDNESLWIQGYAGFRIRNSKEEGNDAFHIGPRTEDSSIAVLPVIWNNRKMILDLLDIKNEDDPGLETIFNEDDGRKFMVLFNRSFKRPYPTALIIKYVEEDNDWIITDVDEGDLGVIDFVRKEFMSNSWIQELLE